MKKFIRIFAVAILLLPLLLASCSDSSSAAEAAANAAAQGGESGAANGAASGSSIQNRVWSPEELVNVRFGTDSLASTDSSKALTAVVVSYTDYSVDALYWRYTAYYMDGSNSGVPGTAADETTLTDEPGLDWTVYGFAPSSGTDKDWHFTLYAYEDEEYTTLLYRSPDYAVNLAASTSTGDKPLTNEVKIPVAPVQDAGDGKILIDLDNISFKLLDEIEAYVSPSDLKAGDENVWINYRLTTSDETDTTSITSADLEDGFWQKTVPAGNYTMNFYFVYEGVHYGSTRALSVFSNFDTKVQGSMGFRKIEHYDHLFDDLDEVYTSATYWTAGSLTSFTTLPEYIRTTYTQAKTLLEPVKPRFDFVGWTTYTEWTEAHDLSVIDPRTHEALTIYAYFVPVPYSISYDMNAYLKYGKGVNKAAVSDTTVDDTVVTPTDMYKSYDFTSSTFILKSATNITRDGYDFSGWTSGTTVSHDDTTELNYSIPENTWGDLSFYAHWTAHKYSVAFDGNTVPGSNGLYGNGENVVSGSVETQSGHEFDVNKALPDKGGFTMEGYTQYGWSTTKTDTSAGGNTTFTNAESVHNLTTASNETVTLYALWAPNSYTVKYYGNTSSPTNATTEVSGSDVADSRTFLYDTEYLPLDATDSAVGMSRPGYRLAGWTTDSDNLGTLYTTKTSFSNLTTKSDAEVSLYAKWVPNTYTITIKTIPMTIDSVEYVSAADDVTATVVFDDTTVTSFTAPTQAYANLLGYYTTMCNIDTTSTNIVLTTGSNVLWKSAANGITNARGQYTTPNDITLYTMWVTNTDFAVYGATDVTYMFAYSVVTSDTSYNSSTRTTTTNQITYLAEVSSNAGELSYGQTSITSASFAELQSAARMSVTKMIKTWTYNSDTGTVVKQPDRVENLTAVLEGFYTEADGAGTQVIDSEGKFKASVDGLTDSSGKWICQDGVATLYAKWGYTE